MAHDILSLVALKSLRGLLDTLFADEAIRSSPRLAELASRAEFFLSQTEQELQDFVSEHHALRKQLYPLPPDEKA